MLAPQPDSGAVQQVVLHEVSRRVQFAEVGAAAREEMHVAVFDARQQQIVRGAPRAFAPPAEMLYSLYLRR
jgi:hypothetical protein